MYTGRNKNREHKQIKYPMGDCDWCMAWGNTVNSTCTHSSDNYLYKPNGEIQKKIDCIYKVL